MEPEKKKSYLKRIAFKIPDTLTLSRLFLGLALISLIPHGASSTTEHLAVLFLIIGILSDILDGRLARKFKIVQQSAIGRNEISCDMLMAAGYLFYAGSVGILPVIVGVGWGILTFTTALLPNNNDIYLKPKKLIQIPGFFLMAYLARFLDWQTNLAAIGILALMLIIDWKRADELRQERKKDFGNWFKGARNLYQILSPLEKLGWSAVLAISIYFYFRLNDDLIAAITLPIFFAAIYTISSERLIRNQTMSGSDKA